MQLLKRSAITILGVGLLVVGVVLMVLPGPGILLIVGGLAVLATEYVWAQRLLKRARASAEQVQEAAVASPVRTAGSVVFALGMVAVGIAMLVVPDVSWPVYDALLDGVWQRVTGSILVIMGLVLCATTYLTIRAAKGRETTFTGPHSRAGTGAHRLSRG